MKQIHFNSAAQYAVRDISGLIPGRLYLDVHTRSNDPFDYSFPPFFSYVWVTGLGQEESVGRTLGVVYFANAKSGNLDRRFLGDAGVWNQGGYKNSVNYLLDVAALIERGVKILETVSPGTDMTHRPNPLSYAFDSYYNDDYVYPRRSRYSIYDF